MRTSSLSSSAILGLSVAVSACGSATGPLPSHDGGTTVVKSIDAGVMRDAAADVHPGAARDVGTPEVGTESDASIGRDAGPGDTATPVVEGGFPDAAVGPFPFPPVTYQGGPLITAPNVVTITFPNDPLASPLAAYGASATSSAYWDIVRAGYCSGDAGTCIGDGTTATTVVLTSAPAASYTDSTGGGAASLQSFITTLIGENQLPAPTANTLYTFYFPTSTTITLDGGVSCTDFDGYHNSLSLNGTEVNYAIVPECAAAPLTVLQNTTITASHEVIEASSDPDTLVFSFYLDLSNQATYGWDDVLGGEVGDLCVDQFNLGQDETTEEGFTVQRIWSIPNATAGKNPCVPIPPGEVYFNAYPTVNAVILGVGESATIEVDALADGPMGTWTVLPEDWTSETPFVSFAIEGIPSGDGGPEVQMKSGDRIHLKVTLLTDPSTTPNGEVDAVIVSANGTRETATAAHFWPFIVLTPTEAGQLGVTMMKRHREAPHVRSHSRYGRGLR